MIDTEQDTVAGLETNAKLGGHIVLIGGLIGSKHDLQETASIEYIRMYLLVI